MQNFSRQGSERELLIQSEKVEVVSSGGINENNKTEEGIINVFEE